MLSSLSFSTGNESNLDDIKELWEKLKTIHQDKSPYFENYFKEFTFQKRKEQLNSYARKGELFLIIAKIYEEKIGYCIASVKENIGEIDSIYVKEKYQKMNIGKTLIEKSLDWIKLKNPEKIVVNISIGNKEVSDFYSKYGFKPRLTQLEMNFMD